MQKHRIFVERKVPFRVEEKHLLENLNIRLNLKGLKSVRIIHLYDIFNLDIEKIRQVAFTIFADPATDQVEFNQALLLSSPIPFISIELLPGLFDNRAQSANDCLQLIYSENQTFIKTGKLYFFDGVLTNEDLLAIKKFLINPIESREKDLTKIEFEENKSIRPIKKFDTFLEVNENQLLQLKEEEKWVMTIEDLLFVQDYFKNEEKRVPSETELKLIDTYWSDHCRHTTFRTQLTKIDFADNAFSKKIEKQYHAFLECRKALGKKIDNGVSLMDLATTFSSYLIQQKIIKDVEISDEINACSLFVDVKNEDTQKTEKWLLQFKNETHNHPTEIEPYGGASTCIGGAIRDPLSGRAYVFQAMRISGSGNIFEPIEKTIKGKLPQFLISKGAALGFSSYGNQIGLATSFVKEIFHEGYKAKRMEVGVVVGAVLAENVKREKPCKGDIVILLGGKTGRDGIGGATGSSKEQNEKSLELASAEVQKGNATEERKLQRFFRNPEVSKKIKKCNDFGAGGISVAVGELAESIEIDLHTIALKYQGLNATEIALSESQERMALLIAKDDLSFVLKAAQNENIEAYAIATITDDKRLKMKWNNEYIVNIKRDFLDSNGITQKMQVAIPDFYQSCQKELLDQTFSTCKEKIIALLQDPNISSQKGMVEMFDASIGASTILMPYGGKSFLGETQTSVQGLPTHYKTSTCSMLAYGFNPFLSESNPYYGGVMANLEAITKIVASGGSYKNIRFSYQEYFERLEKDPQKWAKPFMALLGAFEIQQAFQLPAIGGKDSMSGTFKNLNVPPTLIAFGVTTTDVKNILLPYFQTSDSYIYLITSKEDITELNYQTLKKNFEFIENSNQEKKILSAFAIQQGGLIEAICKMSFGNKIGVNIQTNQNLFAYQYGSIIIETQEKISYEQAVLIGKTEKNNQLVFNETRFEIEEAIGYWTNTFETMYPSFRFKNENQQTLQILPTIQEHNFKRANYLVDEVKVCIPVFQGTNCEYDSEKIFREAGAKTNITIFRNQNKEEIYQSIEKLAQEIEQSQILMLSGGFSAADEPDGSGKYIANVLRNKRIQNAIEKLLAKDGLILGICNGFQALLKSGYLPFNESTTQQTEGDVPTLYKNDINRHISSMVKTRISSVQSPWLRSFKVGETHTIAVSHGEGKFIASEKILQTLTTNHQIVTQYVNEQLEATMEYPYNPNGSLLAVEGICSLDGKILGKMGHSERTNHYNFKNIPNINFQNLFLNGVNFLKK